MNVFRQHTTARKGILVFIVALFVLSAFVSNQRQSIQTSWGKRKLDLHAIQHQFEKMLNESPHLNPQELQHYLVDTARRQLKLYQNIEHAGLKPSPNALKTALKTLLSQGESLKTVAKRLGKTPDELIQSLQDQMALTQLTQAVEASQFETPVMQALKSQVATQKRHYEKVALQSSKKLPSQAIQEKIYTQHQAQMVSNPTYHYQVIDITPSTVKLSPPTHEDIQAYYKKNPGPYQDAEIHYSVTEERPSNPKTQTHAQTLSNVKHYKTELSHMQVGETRQLMGTKGTKTLTLLDKKPIDHIAPHQEAQLRNDCQQAHFEKQMHPLIEEMSEYTYTHPYDIQETAEHYGLKVQHKQTQTLSPELQSLLTDPDIAQKHYTSNPVKIAPNHYQVIQLTKVEPARTLSLEESEASIHKIYREQYLYPEIAQAIRQNQAQALKDYELLIEPVHYDLDKLNKNPLLNNLIPTLTNPNPDRILQDGQDPYWIRFSHISFDHEPIGLDGYFADLANHYVIRALQN